MPGVWDRSAAEPPDLELYQAQFDANYAPHACPDGTAWSSGPAPPAACCLSGGERVSRFYLTFLSSDLFPRQAHLALPSPGWRENYWNWAQRGWAVQAPRLCPGELEGNCLFVWLFRVTDLALTPPQGSRLGVAVLFPHKLGNTRAG